MSRTQEEILARIAEATDQYDMFGFRREVLVHGLDFEHAKPYLHDHATAEKWAQREPIEDAARGYLAFAIGKIIGHRGISAWRSVEKLREYAWLMGRDDAVAAMDGAAYPQYGAPQVKAFATTLGWPWPGLGLDDRDAAELERMATGRPCTDDCMAGCGR